LQGKNGLVIASDSRGTFGDPREITAQNDTIRKVYLVRNVGISQAGAQYGNIIVQQVEKTCKLENIVGATNIMETARDVSIGYYKQWFPETPILPSAGQNPAFMSLI
jgi:hypothetical protein